MASMDTGKMFVSCDSFSVQSILPRQHFAFFDPLCSLAVRLRHTMNTLVDVARSGFNSTGNQLVLGIQWLHSLEAFCMLRFGMSFTNPSCLGSAPMHLEQNWGEPFHTYPFACFCRYLCLSVSLKRSVKFIFLKPIKSFKYFIFHSMSTSQRLWWSSQALTRVLQRLGDEMHQHAFWHSLQRDL